MEDQRLVMSTILSPWPITGSADFFEIDGTY
jgi:hypothetical protein